MAILNDQGFVFHNFAHGVFYSLVEIREYMLCSLKKAEGILG